VIAIPCLESTGFWKPTLHLRRAVRGDQAHPSWRWVWDGMRFCVPLLDGGGAPRELISGVLGTTAPAGFVDAAWERQLPGDVQTFDGNRWYEWASLSIPPARPITVLAVARVDNVAFSRCFTAQSRTATSSAWGLFAFATTAVCALINAAAPADEVDIGAMALGAWYAIAATTDRTGGTPRGAMLRLDTRQLTTATGTQSTAATATTPPTLAGSPDTGHDEWALNGAVALAAWLPGVAWTDRQLVTWVHDPFAFLIPARVWWMPSAPAPPPPGAGPATRRLLVGAGV
jgi:hypothetical protein